MVIRMNEELDENFDPIYRNHGWSNLKPTATDQNVFDMAKEPAEMNAHTTSVGSFTPLTSTRSRNSRSESQKGSKFDLFLYQAS